ncbi:hypothetical protein B0H17DRAFT_4486 [Mycena rosella]|uniref:Uncharacterized protein n=1 Tax=Mycena rosella TaxID=1033263 RepID=A0AAD7H3J9_MYCRO|nr:hypothetical protein B0H17DRAFT_4486 [Mycena rosella]
MIDRPTSGAYRAEGSRRCPQTMSSNTTSLIARPVGRSNPLVHAAGHRRRRCPPPAPSYRPIVHAGTVLERRHRCTPHSHLPCSLKRSRLALAPSSGDRQRVELYLRIQLGPPASPLPVGTSSCGRHSRIPPRAASSPHCTAARAHRIWSRCAFPCASFFARACLSSRKRSVTGSMIPSCWGRLKARVRVWMQPGNRVRPCISVPPAPLPRVCPPSCALTQSPSGATDLARARSTLSTPPRAAAHAPHTHPAPRRHPLITTEDRAASASNSVVPARILAPPMQHRPPVRVCERGRGPMETPRDVFPHLESSWTKRSVHGRTQVLSRTRTPVHPSTPTGHTTDGIISTNTACVHVLFRVGAALLTDARRS